MVFAVVVGACAAVALFAVRLFLPAKIGARYDRGVVAGFRWLGIASFATLIGLAGYAVFVGH